MVFSAVALVILVLTIISCGQAAPAPAPAPTPAPAPAPAVPAKTINLKFAAYHSPTTDEAKLGQEFIDLIQVRTNGAVQIQYFTGGSLLKAGDMYDGVQNGIADIGEGALSYNPGKFPEMDLSTAPLGVPSPWSITHTVNELYKKYKPAEYNSTHVLWMWGNGPAVLMTSKKQVTNLDELKSLKIRAQALTGEIAKALGAAATSYAMSEMYDGLSKGVVDGVLVDPSVLVSFKLGDVVKYVTDVSKAIGNSYTFYITMNNDSWNKLPDNIKDIFTRTADELIEKSAVAINQQDIAGIDYFKKAGGQIVPLSSAEAARWQAAVSTVTDNYIASVTKVGISEAVQREHLKYMQDRIAYWEGEQVKRGIPFPLK
ncbi:MAG: hypothetical protein A2144_05245 [Chloroflexi bacterium RBG_16_50_9]|nr:MAG: hypothetical protein A2144_05245 [Chloroflexi bacterium RBG_16_50_9]